MMCVLEAFNCTGQNEMESYRCLSIGQNLNFSGRFKCPAAVKSLYSMLTAGGLGVLIDALIVAIARPSP